ncbi:hypothetical protein F2P81_008547 [Scophthalmus maximus]|uniref:Uncharacterized protein n=1 Tax=Scophthalmus maximus TaxID=52904 RepID=A0A6A4SVY1_SCOMX|nr:hypothetical protein F2P81_008547 [Scophthalmus maximus]
MVKRKLRVWRCKDSIHKDVKYQFHLSGEKTNTHRCCHTCENVRMRRFFLNVRRGNVSDEKQLLLLLVCASFGGDCPLWTWRRKTDESALNVSQYQVLAKEGTWELRSGSTKLSRRRRGRADP